MKRFGLVFLLVVLVGLVLTGAYWFAANPSNSLAQTQVENQDRSRDPLLSPAAMRWRHSQPHHWRTCMLQR